MPDKNMWMVRAGRGAKYIDDFLDGSFVGIGMTTGKIDEATPKTELEERLKAEYPTAKEGAIAVWAAQIKRYFVEIQINDTVATYDPSRRFYFLGSVKSTVSYRDHALRHQRRVEWTQKVPRDVLSVSTRNSLGAISTLFLIPEEAAAEMRAKAIAVDAEIGEEEPAATTEPTDEATDKDLLNEVVSKAKEFIEDRIAQLSWSDMEELVAGILEAMGYRARVSTKGADRGVDIFASPDGLGLEEPRIFVEVKHRPATSIGAQEIRAFLGGRQQGDRCLYVSTGGFTKDARYEAERSSIPVTLISLPELAELLVDHYSKLETSVAAMVPLERIYWPVA